MKARVVIQTTLLDRPWRSGWLEESAALDMATDYARLDATAVRVYNERSRLVWASGCISCWSAVCCCPSCYNKPGWPFEVAKQELNPTVLDGAR